MKHLIAWRLFDADGTLSLSNVLFAVLIAKVALARELDWTIVSGLLLTLANHNARKVFAKARADKTVADHERLTQLANEVKSLGSAVSLQNLRR